MQIFIADIDSISKNTDDYLSWLTPEHQARAKKFQKRTRKLQFILGHLIVDKIGKKYSSIAHKDKLVVVATASNTPVGVDIENVSIKRDFVNAAVIAGIKTPKTLYDFYKLFTEAEAAYKLGEKPVCTHFIDYGYYLICITANHKFTLPHLEFLDIRSFLPAKKK